MEKHLKEMNTNLVKLYSLFNGMNEFMFANDSSCNEIEITCKNTLSAESHLMTMEQLKNKYAELQKSHSMVKQQLFDQSVEFKDVQQRLESLSQQHERRESQEQRLENLQTILEEHRAENEKMSNMITSKSDLESLLTLRIKS